MQEEMFSPPLAFLLVTHPQYGPASLRAILEACKNGGLDLDTVFEYDNENAHLIDTNLSWGFLEESNKGEFEKRLCKKLVGQEADCVHYLRQFGLMQCKCRNELKMLTHEMAGARPVDSSTRLMDFAQTHPEIFDLLWC